MAQYLDGLRGIWEHAHTAAVKTDPTKVQLFTISSNALIHVKSSSKMLADGFVADVGDGTRVNTTIVGSLVGGHECVDYEQFRDSLAAATISDLDERQGVAYAVEV